METKTINVRICAGTHCYLMGGAELQLFHEYLPAGVRHQVVISGSPCLGVCDRPGAGKPPFVMVNDKILQQTTIHSLLEEVKKELQN